MNYSTIEDAWKSSDYLSDQFSLYKKKTIENFDIQNKYINQDNKYFNQNNHNNQDNQNNQNNQNNKYTHSDLESTNLNQNVQEHFTNNYIDNVFICNDFWDHLNKCSSCRNKIRQRFSSNVMDRFENVVIDNKDPILIFLICLFALLFCNLLISIINK